MCFFCQQRREMPDISDFELENLQSLTNVLSWPFGRDMVRSRTPIWSDSRRNQRFNQTGAIKARWVKLAVGNRIPEVHCAKVDLYGRFVACRRSVSCPLRFDLPAVFVIPRLGNNEHHWMTRFVRGYMLTLSCYWNFEFKLLYM